MAGKKGFEDFEGVFGEAMPEWDSATAAAPLCPSLFYAHAPDPSRIQIVATDFHSLTFSRDLTVHDLEDLRDDIGIGGSWSEFFDYLRSSLSSGEVRLILDGSQNVDYGDARANLIALKSKGLPRISLSLNRVLSVAANDTKAKLSLALFKAFKKKHLDAVKEQERFSRLMESLSSERERNDNLQKQLDSLSFLSKRKAPKSLEKESTTSDVLDNSEKTVNSGLQQSSEVATAKGPQAIKTGHRVAPMSRRSRARGVSLKDAEDNDDH